MRNAHVLTPFAAAAMAALARVSSHEYKAGGLSAGKGKAAATAVGGRPYKDVKDNLWKLAAIDACNEALPSVTEALGGERKLPDEQTVLVLNTIAAVRRALRPRSTLLHGAATRRKQRCRRAGLRDITLDARCAVARALAAMRSIYRARHVSLTRSSPSRYCLSLRARRWRAFCRQR